MLPYNIAIGLTAKWSELPMFSRRASERVNTRLGAYSCVLCTFQSLPVTACFLLRSCVKQPSIRTLCTFLILNISKCVQPPMVTKKRKSSGASILPNPTPKGQEKGTKKPVENAEVPFCIALPAPLPPSKKRKLGNASSPRVGKLHVSHFDPRLKLDYTVQRMKNADVKGEWDGEGMRIYNTFSRGTSCLLAPVPPISLTYFP